MYAYGHFFLCIEPQCFQHHWARSRSRYLMPLGHTAYVESLRMLENSLLFTRTLCKLKEIFLVLLDHIPSSVQHVNLNRRLFDVFQLSYIILPVFPVLCKHGTSCCWLYTPPSFPSDMDFWLILV